ncbi:MAG: glucose-6-phosphate dehydrogenase assembly protein OpcA [Chloroflexota bacterium]|nr:glucose-6-phosphate dehydrogenase assembly protein OpcA [Chloroflexota bacterium]
MSSAVDRAVWGTQAPSLAALEGDLARVRRGRSAHVREQVATVARAAVVNIVVVAVREMHARRAARTVSGLAMRHPSRAIIVLSDRAAVPDAPPRIDLYAQIPAIDRSAMVSYEQILVSASGRATDRLVSVVVPLLVPDLPVFLWWTDAPPIGARHFEELVAISDRLVVDSADFARPEETLPELSHVCSLGARRCGLTDLNWGRVTCWRELVTQLFDVPAWRPWLDRVDGIRIAFGVDADGRQVHPSQALLLVGWLASRLGWTAAEPISPSEAGGYLFAVRRRDGEVVRVRIRPRYALGMGAGDVVAVRIEASDGAHRAEFAVTRAAGGRNAVASVLLDGRPVSERSLPHAQNDVVELLSEELTIVAADRVYEEALATLLRLS